MSRSPAAVTDTVAAARPDATASTRLALAALALSMLLSALGTSIANVGLPTLAHAFDVPFQAVQWVVLAYLLAITTAVVSAGRLGDLVGRRRLLQAGIALFTGASVLCGLAPSLPVLIAARAAQGLGAAVMMALTLAFVGALVPKAQTGRAMGLLGTMSALGTALGPVLGGVLIAALGWRAMFLVGVPVGVVAFALARRYLPEDRPAVAMRGADFDLPGTLLLALALAAYALAMTTGQGTFGPRNAVLLALAAGATALFVVAESRAASPLLRLALLRRPMLGAGLATSALVAAVIMATMVIGPFHLARALGLDPTHVGLVLAVGPMVVALTAVPAGRMADRFGTCATTRAGLVAMAAGALALALLPPTLGVPGYLAPLVVITAGYGLFQTANNTAVMADVDADLRGVTSGMLNLSRNLGLVTGTAVLGTVFAIASGADDVATASPDAVATGMRAAFAVAAALVVGALVIATRGCRTVTRDRDGCACN